MANACASHGARKTGPLSSRGIPGRASAARRAAVASMNDASGTFEIRFKRFDGDFQIRFRIRAPKLLRVEAHGVKPLRIVTLSNGGRVRKEVRAVQALDHADTAARVARQTRMGRRMNV